MGSWVTLPLLGLLLMFYSLNVNTSWITMYKKLQMPQARWIIYNIDVSKQDYLITVLPNTADSYTLFKSIEPWTIFIVQMATWGDCSAYNGTKLIEDWYSIFQITEMLKGNYYIYLDKDNKIVTNYNPNS